MQIFRGFLKNFGKTLEKLNEVSKVKRIKFYEDISRSIVGF